MNYVSDEEYQKEHAKEAPQGQANYNQPNYYDVNPEIS
jgi:hypothetical protein